MSRISVIIPARGGSKGIPLKNITLVNGKPLIYYCINTLLKSNIINDIIVSTDSELISDTVLKEFSEVQIIKRPKSISLDTSVSEDCILHAIETINYKPDIVLFVQATSPLTTTEDFDKLISMVKNNKKDSASFYTDDLGFFIGEDDIFSPYLPRQARVPRKRIAGNAWCFTTIGFLTNRSRLFGDVGFVNIPFPRNLEIDSLEELEVVSYCLRSNRNV